MKVLVVEDDPLVRTFAAQALADEGFAVIEAADGDEALRLFQEINPDVLFTDLRLEGTITGWEVAELCREINPRVPVVYATGFSQVVPRPVPGSIWFQKPYQADQVAKAIHSLVSDEAVPSPNLLGRKSRRGARS